MQLADSVEEPMLEAKQNPVWGTGLKYGMDIGVFCHTEGTLAQE